MIYIYGFLLLGIVINYSFILYLLYKRELHFTDINFKDGLLAFLFVSVPFLFTFFYIYFNRTIKNDPGPVKPKKIIRKCPRKDKKKKKKKNNKRKK